MNPTGSVCVFYVWSWDVGGTFVISIMGNVFCSHCLLVKNMRKNFLARDFAVSVLFLLLFCLVYFCTLQGGLLKRSKRIAVLIIATSNQEQEPWRSQDEKLMRAPKNIN